MRGDTSTFPLTFWSIRGGCGRGYRCHLAVGPPSLLSAHFGPAEIHVFTCRPWPATANTPLPWLKVYVAEQPARSPCGPDPGGSPGCCPRRPGEAHHGAGSKRLIYRGARAARSTGPCRLREEHIS